jgi:hypothetical protein
MVFFVQVCRAPILLQSRNQLGIEARRAQKLCVRFNSIETAIER